MFKTGDVVEMTADAAATGLLDFVQGDGYKVIDVYTFSSPQIKLREEGGKIGWYYQNHFKLKEDTIVEKKECLFKEGQVVWDLRNGRGVVEKITNDERYPVKVKLDLKDMDGDEITDYYMADGRYVKTQTIRSLYFSEPKIEAATEPLFEPTLQVGTPIILSKYDVSSQMIPAWVTKETEDSVTVSTTDSVNRVFYKKEWNIYSVGEKINFK